MKLWHAFLNAKMTTQMSNSANIEDAFQKVRIVGELSDTEEMVQKVMTKEQDYNDLVKSVIVSKSKVDTYVDKNEVIEKRIRQLELSKLENTSDIKDISDKVDMETKEIAFKKDRLKKISTVVQNVSIWMKKIIKHINKNSDKHIELVEGASIAQMSQILREYIKTNVKESSFAKKRRVAKLDEVLSELPPEVKQKLMHAKTSEMNVEESEFIKGLSFISEA